MEFHTFCLPPSIRKQGGKKVFKSPQTPSSQAGPSQSEQGWAEPSHARLSQAAPGRSERSRAEPDGAHQAHIWARPDPSQAQLSWAKPRLSDSSRAGPSQADLSRAWTGCSSPKRSQNLPLKYFFSLKKNHPEFSQFTTAY